MEELEALVAKLAKQLGSLGIVLDNESDDEMTFTKQDAYVTAKSITSCLVQVQNMCEKVKAQGKRESEASNLGTITEE